jgi:hypothetical protein
MAELTANQEYDTKIVLSSRVFDPLGYLPLKVRANSVVFDKTRRISRSATLDGGAYITDFGYTDSDRTLTFIANKLTPTQQESVEYFLRTYAEIGVATYDGFFTGALSGSSIRNGEMRLTFLVKERLSDN